LTENRPFLGVRCRREGGRGGTAGRLKTRGPKKKISWWEKKSRVKKRFLETKRSSTQCVGVGHKKGGEVGWITSKTKSPKQKIKGGGRPSLHSKVQDDLKEPGKYGEKKKTHLWSPEKVKPSRGGGGKERFGCLLPNKKKGVLGQTSHQKVTEPSLRNGFGG